MNKSELVQVFRWLSGTGYSQFDNPSENMLNVWYETLGDVPDGYALMGAKNYTKNPDRFRKFPLPSDILERANDEYNEELSRKKQRYLNLRATYDECVANFPGAYFEDQTECKKAFLDACKAVGSCVVIGHSVRRFVKSHEADGTINEIGTLTDLLRSLGDGYKGRVGTDRCAPDGQQTVETSKAHPSPGDAL